MELFKKLWSDEEGQGLIEYALIIAVISLVIIVAGPGVYNAITNIFADISANLNK
jgi:pilus assembly protein Flp/PilA